MASFAFLRSKNNKNLRAIWDLDVVCIAVYPCGRAEYLHRIANKAAQLP